MDCLFEKCIIRDGMTLSAMKTNKFKTGILKLSVALPSGEKERDTALFALMINVLRCGTEKYPEKADIIKRLGDLYDATCSIGGYASGDNRILEISSEMLSDRFSDEGSILNGVAELMDQLLYHPATDPDGLMPEETVEREKKVICDKLKSEKNNSREYAFKRCREIMCKGEPYGRAIKASMIETVSSRELTEYYRDFLKRAEPAFSYVGDKEMPEVAEIIRRNFSGESVGKAEPILPLSCRMTDTVKEEDEELDIKQGVLVMGFRSGILLGDRYSDSMRVFNNIFGGTSTSRLFTVIRERMGMCYYCDSDYVSTKGFVFVSCGIDVDNRDTVQGEILRQLDILKNDPVSHEELLNAKDMAIKELRELWDYQSAIASFRYSHEIYGCEFDIDKKIATVMSVTAEEIMEIARKITLNTVFFLKGTEQEEYDDRED